MNAKGVLKQAPMPPPALLRGVKLLYWLGGSLVIALALTSFAMQMSLPDILAQLQRLFGISFIVLFSLLVAINAWALAHLYLLKPKSSQGADYSGAKSLGGPQQDKRMNIYHKKALWAEVGMQAANGISTLALTFTLLGISLGIGSLANQTLSPETVNGIISELTAQFSMAFMTTVVGLPTATLFRAWVSILTLQICPNEHTDLTAIQE
ncbi:hypothetical protein PN836_001815 [Ningiella sp. W23]|uniref:hypothetical protein n=1 Tax=Ningiella sp. W23 TaxID=3023715 RepID=UPI003757E922